jgi:sigma-B regulation protein RsbU (phosphoserine phosphatase)
MTAMKTPTQLKRVESFLEALNEAVVIADNSGRILFVNSVFSEMTGLSRSDVVGLDARQLYGGPGDYELLEKIRKKTVREGKSRQEFVLPRHDGGRLPVIASIREVQEANGQQFVISTFVDISEEVRAREELRSAYAQLEKRQMEIEQDLRLAARVQQSLAPKPFVSGAIRVDTSYLPARTIGGDFGLVVPFGDEQLNLLVCDVVGHGIGSALLANRIFTEASTLMCSGTTLPDTLRQLNTLAIQDIGGPGFFFTLAAARMERSGRHMVFAGAGHPPAMLVRPEEEPRLLKSQSAILGALPDAVSSEAEISLDLAPGDRLVLYTDGVTDVFNSREEMLGVEGFQEVVREASLLPFPQMKKGILDRVAAWRGGPPVDDVSLVLVEVS